VKLEGDGGRHDVVVTMGAGKGALESSLSKYLA
jgi:hypothetical protein